MTEQPSPERYKVDMPQIPGVSGPVSGRPRGNPAIPLIAGVLAVLIVVLLGARWFFRPKHPEMKPLEVPAQIEVPAPTPDPAIALPHATETHPTIASISELAKPWSAKDFFIRNPMTAEYIPAVIVRLPGGAANQASGYWAFSLKAPYGNCQLEYVTDLAKMQTEYGFRAAKHPMAGNPCSHTLFDPTKMATMPGNFLVRGAIVQGSDLRPPLGVEIKIQGKDIQAVRTE
jgi:hypothetical protein